MMVNVIPKDKGLISNRNAIMAFVIAKICGFIGLCLAYSAHRTIGFALLMMDAVLLSFAIYSCIKIMLQVKDEWKDAGEKS